MYTCVCLSRKRDVGRAADATTVLDHPQSFVCVFMFVHVYHTYTQHSEPMQVYYAHMIAEFTTHTLLSF